jgi:hypothetical protein
MERVAPVVDATIAALSHTRFIEDPVAGIKYSRATSIISSAYKRHGKILETAIREGLRDSNRHRVWSEDSFRVSTAANALVTSLIGLEGEEACRKSALPYGERARTLQVDMMAYDEGETAKVAPVSAEARIIFYYGVRSIPRPWSLIREDLDEHFGFPIVEKVEQANGYFRERLHQLLETA